MIFAQCPISVNYDLLFVCMFACLLGEHVSVPIYLVSDLARTTCQINVEDTMFAIIETSKKSLLQADKSHMVRHTCYNRACFYSQLYGND